MDSVYRKVRAYLRFACTAGIVLSVAVCSSDMTAPQLVQKNGSPITIGSLTLNGTTAIVDTTIQVSVTVKNDSTAPVSFTVIDGGRSATAY